MGVVGEGKLPCEPSVSQPVDGIDNNGINPVIGTVGPERDFHGPGELINAVVGCYAFDDSVIGVVDFDA